MYHIRDKEAAVKEIQKFLFTISDVAYPEIPRIPIDGKFDNETKKAVEKFQQIKGIEITGIVNNETFRLLYEEYAAVNDEKATNDSIVGDNEFPLTEGSNSEDVRALHILINELRKTYTEIPDVGIGSYYNRRTADAVRLLREIYMLVPSDSVDKALYSRLTEDLNARRRVKEKYT